MRTIGARKTFVQPLILSVAEDFLRLNHRQGLALSGKNPRAYGLFSSSDELLAVALFCNPRTRGMQKRYTTELFHLAFKKEVRVQGGASKLIKYFLATGPWDLFTYQDTSGEASTVYEHAGMSLIGTGSPPPKQILVAKGLSHASALDNRKDWFSIEQVVRHGPDKLIGTKLGEVYREDGSRKSNLALFIEDCSYHLEDVPGDRVYEWRNPEVSFYTYKLTSTLDNCYYFGRRVIRKRNPTPEECLNDEYLGSGGKKFQAWINHVGEKNILKSIQGIYSRWSEVVEAETKLIGDRHLTDPLCKNYQPGGVGLTRLPVSFSLKDCAIHGASIHQGNRCRKCSAREAKAILCCELHGEVPHQGLRCKKCIALSGLKLKQCAIHGEVIHRGEQCASCSTSALVSLATCEIHGVGNFVGGRCKKCMAKEALHTRDCLIHGLVLHQGDSCVSCVNDKAIKLAICAVHGETKHRGSSCYKCAQTATVSYSQCPIHGEVKFQSGKCASCSSENSIQLRLCSVHGETKHQGLQCRKCLTARSIKLMDCDIHGEVKHRGSSCMTCSALRTKAAKAAKKLESLSRGK